MKSAQKTYSDETLEENSVIIKNALEKGYTLDEINAAFALLSLKSGGKIWKPISLKHAYTITYMDTSVDALEYAVGDTSTVVVADEINLQSVSPSQLSVLSKFFRNREGEISKPNGAAYAAANDAISVSPSQLSVLSKFFKNREGEISKPNGAAYAAANDAINAAALTATNTSENTQISFNNGNCTPKQQKFISIQDKHFLTQSAIKREYKLKFSTLFQAIDRTQAIIKDQNCRFIGRNICN